MPATPLALALCLSAVNGLALPSMAARTRPVVMIEPIGSSVASGPGRGQASKAVSGTPPPITVQGGGSLRTWSYQSPAIERVQVVLSSQGRPLDADIELYHGPSNTPVKMRAYVENGQRSPFSAVIETPRSPSTVAIRNIGSEAFPFTANVIHQDVPVPSPECVAARMTIQGGALRTFPFDPSVESVQVVLTTDGRPLNARLELLQGPNNNKQVIEIYSEDGFDRPCFFVLETPGAGNVVRVCNTSPVEFPLACGIVPDSINQAAYTGGQAAATDVVMGGGGGSASFSSDGASRQWWE